MPKDLDEIEITGVNEHPPTESVRLHGPPGTGKTTESAARVGKLIREHGYDVGDIAWATYRKSLAADTLNRLVEWDLIEEAQLDEPSKGPTRYIATTHAVANRATGKLPGPADRSDRIDFCDRRGLRYTSPRPWADGVGEMLFSAFSWLKTNRLDPTDPADFRKWPGFDDLREKWNGDPTGVWDDWVAYKHERELIDYYEMLERPLEEGVAPPVDVLVLDEYHDATPLMAELSEMWAAAADTVIVAGDPHQVVNAYDGADPAFFERLNLPKILLDTTYRVPEQAWRLATTMLGQAHSPPAVDRAGEGYIDEYLSPAYAYDYGTGGWDTPDPAATASPPWLCEQYDGDTLFLTRMKMQAAGVAHALDKAGIIYGSQSDLAAWGADSDRLLLHNAMQKWLQVTPGDFDSTGGVTSYSTSAANPDKIRLSTAEAQTLLEYTPTKHLAQNRAKTTELSRSLWEDRVEPTLIEFAEWTEDSFLHTFTGGPGSVERLNKGDLDATDQTALQKALARYDGPVSPDEVDVEVMTIHASKGKGAENVVLFDGTSPRTARDMQTSDETWANEYRTWYVGLTRASKRVCIMRSAFEWTVPVIPDDLELVVTSGGGAQDTGDAQTDAQSAQTDAQNAKTGGD